MNKSIHILMGLAAAGGGSVNSQQEHVYRVTITGLSRGSIWLNGHNLGRYPEKIPGLNSLYLPECWLKPGANELAVFDEKGQSPARIQLVSEAASGFEAIALKH